MTAQTIMALNRSSNAGPAGRKSHKTLSPYSWVRRGVDDFRHHPMLSLALGGGFLALCALVAHLSAIASWYTIGYLTVLLVLFPFMASCLYAVSRDIEAGVQPTLERAIGHVRHRASHIAMFSLALALVMVAWVRLSALAFVVIYTGTSITPASYLSTSSSPDGWMTMAFYTVVATGLGIILFVGSAVAIPKVFDGTADFITSIVASYRTALQHPLVVAKWAGIVLLFTAMALATGGIGLAVAFPILGYATWHSYRAIAQ